MTTRLTRWIVSAILLSLAAGVALAILVSPLALGNLSNSNTQVGVFYSATIPATGGVPDYTYAIVAGSLPHNLTFSPNTPTSGAMTISGTPDTAGTANFTVMVTDSSPTPPADPFSSSTGPDGQSLASRRGLAQGSRHNAAAITKAFSIIVAPAAPSSTPVPPSVWMAMTGLAGAGLFRLRQKRRG